MSEVSEVFRIRQSLINVWMKCSLQARFESIDRMPRKQNAAASFGTCIHNALEHYNHHGDVERAVKEFTETWDNPELLNCVPEVWPRYTSFSSYRERGIRLLRDYHSKLKWDERSVVATEHNFCVPFGEFELTGTVDLLEIRKNGRGVKTLNIVDYKTNRAQPNRTELLGNIQFTTYHYASLQPEFWLGYKEYPAMKDGEYWWNRMESFPRRNVWFQLETTKEIDAGPRDEKDHERLYRACVEIKNAIDKEVFVPNISASSCLYCNYHEPCGLRIPTQEEIEADDERWF